MPAKQRDEVIALNLPLDLSKAGSFRERVRGKRKKKMTYSLEIQSDPIAVKVNAYGLGKESAAALQTAFYNLIKKAGEDTSIAESTEWRRDVYVGQYQRGNPTALKHFDTPKKKDGSLRKNALPDSPPIRGEYGWFNHSGRLREGIALKWVPSRLSWYINAPANRFNRQNFGQGFQAFLEEFEKRVNPQKAIRDPAFRKSMDVAAKSAIVKLGKQISDKKLRVLISQLNILRGIAKSMRLY